MKFIVFLIGFSQFGFAASKAVKCDIQTLRDANACMEKMAENWPEYEMPNEGFGSDRTQKLAGVIKVLNLSPRLVKKATEADFAGVLIEYGDEYHIYYFSLKKGKQVKPVKLYDLNTVDLQYILEKPYSTEALDPQTYLLGMGQKGTSIVQDLEDRIKEIKDNQ